MKYLILIVLLFACTSAPKKKALPGSLQEAVEGPHRSEEFTKNTEDRFPVELLAFFGLTPSMTVVEVYPGAGWYMEIVAPYVAGSGKYIMGMPYNDRKNKDIAIYEKKIMAWMTENFEVAKSMTIKGFGPPERLELGKPETADLVVSFRNAKNWIDDQYIKEIFTSFYQVLKPGGALGLVAYGTSGDEIIRQAKKSGFRFEKKQQMKNQKTSGPLALRFLKPLR